MTTVYVNHAAAVDGDGSYGAPYNTWASVVWTAGNTYLMSTDGTCREEITIGADDVEIGAYGDGEMAVVDGSIPFVPVWSAAANGEFTCTPPANSFGDATDIGMLLWEGQPINKRGSVGSLTPGEWQLSAGTVYYRPVTVRDLPRQLEACYQDSAIRQTAAAVRSNVRINNVLIQKTHIAIFSANDGGTEEARNWEITDVRTRWTSRSAIHLIRGYGLKVSGGRFEKYGSTCLNFGLVGGTEFNNVRLRNIEVDDGIPWITDTNLEGHAIDMVEGCSGFSLRNSRIRNHGANYPGTLFQLVSGSTYRPDATVSVDGVEDVDISGNEFFNNALAPVQCGDFIDGSVVQGKQQRISGNVFLSNLRKFDRVDSANATLFACVQVMGATYEAVTIHNNTFLCNGNGLRLTGESQRPCVVYAVGTAAGAALDVSVRNNVFGTNDVSTLLTVRNLSATGTVIGAKISNNRYAAQSDPQWSTAGVVTQRIWVQTSNTSYRVPYTHTFAAYRTATSADSNSEDAVDLSALVDAMGALHVSPNAALASLDADNSLARAGTYVPGTHLRNGRMRPGYCPIGAYAAVLPGPARSA